MKPIKINLTNGKATGMYVLAEESEIKTDSNGNTSAPKKRAYKIQVTTEAIYNNKRCRGKKTINIPANTSMVTAVNKCIPYREKMIITLKEKGTLAKEKPLATTKKIESRIFKECWLNYYNSLYNAKKIRKSTYDGYNDAFEYYLKPIHKKNVDDITIDDVQALIDDAVEKGRGASTIARIKPTIKPILDRYDVLLNWSKLIEPKVDNQRKYTYNKEITLKIINLMRNYHDVQIRSIFAFLLSGRRISEVLAIKYDYINWKELTYKIPKEFVKTKKELEFNLTPILIKAIDDIGRYKEGHIFSYRRRTVLLKFKELVASIGIYDMTLHDIRSMVAQTALDAGANVYDVSAMLAHSTVKTTEKRYVNKTKKQASDALGYFDNSVGLISDEVIDVEVIIDKFKEIKKLYPNASDEQINQAIKILEDKKVLS